MRPSTLFVHHTRIGIDLDEVLASTFLGSIEFAHTRGQALHWKTFEDICEHDFFLDPVLKMTLEESEELWHDYWYAPYGPKNAPVVPGAIDGVDALLQAKKQIYVITARDGADSMKYTGTLLWMKTHFPGIAKEDIFFANHLTSEEILKSTICLKQNITLMIDDNMRNAIDLVEHGIVCLLMERPWNRHKSFSHPLLYRVRDWNEILSLLLT